MTAQYNEALKTYLKDITLREVSRLEKEDAPVSASRVRSLLDAGEDISPYVPQSTYQYLTQGGKENG
jgi:citrate lyase synthetase